MSGTPLWRGAPLVLASRSEIRRRLLEAAGIPLRVEPSEVDERAIETAHGGDAKSVALLLARAKALAAAREEVVLGADQTLALGDRRFTKPASAATAREQLTALSGRTHELHSAVAVARGGTIAFETAVTARLTVRHLSPDFIDRYLAAAGENVSLSVGAYQLEGLGVTLFERVEGDYFTILGLPLLPLLGYFRETGLMVS